MAAVTQVRILVTAWTKLFLFNFLENKIKNIASAGNRTRINCLEGSYADHYTTDAVLLQKLKITQSISQGLSLIHI